MFVTSFVTSSVAGTTLGVYLTDVLNRGAGNQNMYNVFIDDRLAQVYTLNSVVTTFFRLSILHMANHSTMLQR